MLASNGVQSDCVLARVMPDNAWRAVAVHFGAADRVRRGPKQLPLSEESRRKTLKICSDSLQNPRKRRFLPISCSTTLQTHRKRRFSPISCSTNPQNPRKRRKTPKSCPPSQWSRRIGAPATAALPTAAPASRSQHPGAPATAVPAPQRPSNGGPGTPAPEKTGPRKPSPRKPSGRKTLRRKTRCPKAYLLCKMYFPGERKILVLPPSV